MNVWKLRYIILEEVLIHLGYKCRNIHNGSEDVLTNVLLKKPEEIIRDCQMQGDWNIPVINYLLSQHDITAYMNEDTCEDMWVYLDETHDLNVYWDESAGGWRASIYHACDGKTNTDEWLTMNMKTKEV